MKLRYSLVLFSLSLFLGSCDKAASTYRSLIGTEDPVHTVVQSEWEKEPNSIFKKIAHRLNLEEEEMNPTMEGIELEPLPLPNPDKIDLPSSIGGKSVKKPAPKPIKLYAVQVAAYQNLENAKKQRDHLKSKGYKAQISQVKDKKGNTWHSLQIGQFQSLTKAQTTAVSYSDKQTAKSVILKQGVIFKVISPDGEIKIKTPSLATVQPQLPPAKQQQTRPEGEFSFQVGGLFTAVAGDKLAKELAAKGYHPRMVKVQDIAKLDWWYVILIGNYITPEAAVDAADQFSFKENMPATVP